LRTALERDKRRIAPGFPASVLLLVDRWASGGLENLVVDLSRSLTARGLSVFVAAANGPAPPSKTFTSDRSIQTLSFDGDEAAFAAFLRREPVDLINYHHSLFAIDVARRHPIGIVYTMHNCYLWMDEHARQQVELGLAKTDAVIAVSRQVAHFAQAQFHYPDEKITVIGNGLRIGALHAAKRPAVAPDVPFTVVIVGSFDRLKLQHVAIAAFCDAADDIADLRLRLIGAPVDQAYYAQLQAQIAASPHRDRIELIPGLSRTDAIDAMRRAHVFVSASSLEGFGLALVEAAAAGCVCVATDVGCARELRVDGGAVLVIPSPLGELDYVSQSHFYAAISSELPRHREALAEAICRVWRDYPAFAAGIPKTRALLREFCSMQRFTEKYLQVYGAARHQARVSAMARVEESIEVLRAQGAAEIGALDAVLKDALREYAELTRGLEDAQRWILERLTALDPGLISNQEIMPVPEGWPGELPGNVATHRTTVARLFEAINRGNRLGLAFHEEATRRRADHSEFTRRTEDLAAAAARVGALEGERDELTRQLARGRDETIAAATQIDELTRQQHRTRRAMEKAVGERDRARSDARALSETPGADWPRPDAARGATSRSTPLVSVVLPVYNQAYLVDEAIAAVVSQTYENWELIVLDDGSNDDLEHRVRRHIDERRVLFLRQPNQKLPAALNHALAYARGDLLTWTSADNIMLPGQLERLVEELALHPEAGLVYSDYWAIDDHGEPLDDPAWRAHNRDPEIPDLIRLPSEVTFENFHRSGDNFIGASFLYRREIAEIVGRYVDDAFGGEDYDFWLRMHLVTQFRHVAEPLYKYRVHDDTLTARAEELGLFANIRELLEADRWRIETLLTDEGLCSGDSVLRPVSQFHAALLKRCRPVSYGTLVERGPAPTPVRPAIVDIDVPARAIDATVLRQADILLCRSKLTAALLRREDWARDKRILTWNGELTEAAQHAFIQAFAEQVTAPVTAPALRAPPQLDEPFRPGRVLLLVDRWLSGGLENIVIDLARGLAAHGRTVFVASARDAPPPAGAFADAPARTLSFGGDESGFERFLRDEAIEVVNYHHSCFAAGRAREQAVATVYTMHNCYLWMDEAARGQIALGLAEMDRVIAVSRQVAQFAVAQFGVPCDHIVVIANGLRDDIVSAAATPAGNPGAVFTVAMVASLTRPKLQHVAIAAFAAAAQDIPGMRLRLIGAPLDQGYHRELQAQIAASPAGDRIELTPGLSRVETIAALAGAQVFLLPSLVEGCSLALLEAVAAGCVCIASDVGSARDLSVAGGSVVLLPSPLGELESITQRQFLDATAADLPEHRKNIAEALRNVWRDYGAFAAGVADARARLRDLHGMQQMIDAYLLAYTLARRGGGSAPTNHRSVQLAPADLG
jgi:glycosyltransferase involved in cell wall biosynthesis